MQRLLIAGIIVLILLNATSTVVLIYDSERNTDNWEWHLDEVGLNFFIGFEPEQWAEDLRSLDYDFNHYIDYDENKIPILAYLGERTTGGYDVDIDRIFKEDDRTVIRVGLRSPEPGQMVTMGFTYPYSYLLLDRSELVNNVVIVIDQTGRILAEYENLFPGEMRNIEEFSVIY